METGVWTQDRLSTDSNDAPPYSPDNGGTYKFPSPAMQKKSDEQCEGYDNLPDVSSISHVNTEYKSPSSQPRSFPPLRPNRRVDGGIELGNKDLLRDNSNSHSQSRARYSVNPMVHNWRSPLGQFALLISHLL